MFKLPTNIYRIVDCEDKERFDKILDLLDKYEEKPVAIAIFTHFTHSPLPLCDMEKIAKIHKERIKEARERGYICGINYLTTIGHHREYMENTVSADIVRMTNMYGECCDGSCCMNDEKLLEHIRESYRLLSDAEPDFIWVDDDVRLYHMPEGYGCFCDNCIRLFNEEYSYNFTRDELAKVLTGCGEDTIRIRKQWIDRNGKNIAKLLAHIRKSTDEKIPVGFMSGDRFYEGADFDKWMDALSDNGKYDTFLRPGGGAYTDIKPSDFMVKADSIGIQAAFTPKYVTELPSELENFPYQLIKKGPKATVFETTAHIAAGATGIAYNMIPWEKRCEAIEEHLQKINEIKPYHKLLTETLKRSDCVGIHTGYNKYAAVPLYEKTWPNTDSEKYYTYANELFEIGLPRAYAFDSACVYTLTENESEMLSDHELMKMLSRGVYMDAASADVLFERGFGKYIGFRSGKSIIEGREFYLPHEINEGVIGEYRNCRQAFYVGESRGIIKIEDGAEILASALSSGGVHICDAVMGVFENELGGRVCVSGYYPWGYTQECAKNIQLKNLFNYLSRNALPSYVDTYAKIQNRTRILDDGRIAGVLMNFSFDDYKDIKVKVKCESESESVEICSSNMKKYTLKLTSCGEYREFCVKNINAWDSIFFVTVPKG